VRRERQSASDQRSTVNEYNVNSRPSVVLRDPPCLRGKKITTEAQRAQKNTESPA